MNKQIIIIFIIINSLQSFKKLSTFYYIVTQNSNISVSGDEHNLNMIENNSFLSSPDNPHLFLKSFSTTSNRIRSNFIISKDYKTFFRKFVYHDFFFDEIIITIETRNEIEFELKSMNDMYTQWINFEPVNSKSIINTSELQNKLKSLKFISEFQQKAHNKTYCPSLDVFRWSHKDITEISDSNFMLRSDDSKYYFYNLNSFIYKNSLFSIIDNFQNGYLLCFLQYAKFGIKSLVNFRYKMHNKNPLYVKKFRKELLNITCSLHSVFVKKTLEPKNIQLTSFSSAITQAIYDIINLITINSPEELNVEDVSKTLLYIQNNIKLVYLPKFLRRENVQTKNAKEHFFALTYKHKKYFIRLFRNDYFHSEYIGIKIPKYQDYFPLWKETSYSCLMDPIYHHYYSFVFKSPQVHRLLDTNQKGVFYCNRFKRNYILYTIKNFTYGAMRTPTFNNFIVPDKKLNFFDVDEDVLEFSDSENKESGSENSSKENIEIPEDEEKSFYNSILSDKIIEGDSSKNSFCTEKNESEKNMKNNNILYIEKKDGIIEMKKDYDLNKHDDQVYDPAELAKAFKSDLEMFSMNQQTKENILNFFIDDQIGKKIERNVPMYKLFDKKYNFVIKKKILNLNYFNNWESEEMELNGFNLYEGCSKFWIRDSNNFHILICYSINNNFLIFSCDKFFCKKFEKNLESEECLLNNFSVENQWNIDYNLDTIYLNCFKNTFQVTLRIPSLVFSYNKKSLFWKTQFYQKMAKIKEKLELTKALNEENKKNFSVFKFNYWMLKIKSENDQISFWKQCKYVEESFNKWYKTQLKNVSDLTANKEENELIELIETEDVQMKNNEEPIVFSPKKLNTEKFSISFVKDPSLLKIFPHHSLFRNSDSFYEKQFIPISKIAKMNFPNASVVDFESDSFESNFDLVNSYSFEHFFYFGKITNVFCSSMMSNIKFNSYGEIKSFKYDLLLQNEHFLTFAKSNNEMHTYQKVEFPQKHDFTKLLNDENQSFQKNKTNQEKVKISEKVFQRMSTSIFASFHNFKKPKINKTSCTPEKINIKEEGGFKPIFQNKINYQIESREGILLTTLNSENEYKIIYKNKNSVYKKLSELDGCINISYQWVSRTIFCQKMNIFKLFDFSNESNSPQELKFKMKNENTFSDMITGSFYVLDRANKGNFSKIVFYQLQENYLSLKMFNFVSINADQIEHFWHINIELQYKKYLTHYIFNNKLILICKLSVVVYFMDMDKKELILLKEHFWKDVGIFPIIEKEFKLVHELANPDHEFKRNKSTPSVMFIAKRVPVSEVPFNRNQFYRRFSSTRDDLIHEYIQQFEEMNFWNEVHDNMVMNTQPREDYGLVVFDINSDVMSSFKSFIPFSSFRNSSNNSCKFKKEEKSEEDSRQIKVDDIIFFNKFQIYDIENQREKPVTGIYLLHKISDWKDNWAKSSGTSDTAKNNKKKSKSESNLNISEEAKYLNAYSLKIVFPVTPTIKIDLYKDKHKGYSNRVVQLMGIEGQEIPRSGNKNDNDRHDNNLKKLKNQIVQKMKKHYQKVFADNDKEYISSMNNFETDIYIQKSYSFLNKLNTLNILSNIWDKSGNIITLLNYKKAKDEVVPEKLKQKLREKKKRKAQPNKTTKKQKFLSQDLFMCTELNKFRHDGKTFFDSLLSKPMQTYLKNLKPPKKKKKINKLSKFSQNLSNSEYSKFITKFWNTKEKPKKPEMIMMNKYLFDLNPGAEVTIQDLKIMDDFLEYSDSLQNSVKKIKHNSTGTIIQIELNKLVVGNITDFQLELDYPPDNYSPPVTLQPLRRTTKKYPFCPIVSSKLRRLNENNKVFFKEADKFNKVIFITPQISGMFHKNKLKYSFPNEINLHLSKQELNQFTMWDCEYKSMVGFSIIIRFCLLKNAEDLHNIAQRSVKFIFLDDNYLNKQKEVFRDTLAKLSEISFDNFVIKNNFMYFYRENNLFKLPLKGNYRVFYLQKINKKNKILINPIEIFKTPNFFYKFRLFQEVFSAADLLLVTIPIQNKINEFYIEIIYYLDSKLRKSKKLGKIKITETLLAQKLRKNLSNFEIKVVATDKNQNTFKIMIIFPDHLVMFFHIKLAHMSSTFIEIQDLITYSFFKSHITGIHHCKLIFNYVISTNYLVLGSQCRDDSAISILDLKSTMNKLENHELNIFYLKAEIQYAHFQHLYENEVLLFGSKKRRGLKSLPDGEFIELFLVFADRAVMQLFNVNLTLILKRIPFTSNTLFLKMSNPFHSTVVPLDISGFKKKSAKGLSNVSAVSISSLFVLSFFTGFGVLSFFWRKWTNN